jgi:L-ascorbate metabolism protein UlaG (beta-lactamase superfamily)
MSSQQPDITYVGGPTALINFHGVRFLTDPTFDPGGEDYVSGPITLHKISNPAVGLDALGPIDYVLLSHDQHFDNLDHAGRKMLSQAKHVLTTDEGAKRLGGNAIGFAPWQTMEVKTPDGRPLLITATPARHGPFGCEARSGPVVGFAVRPPDSAIEGALYVSGDTVWYEGVAEVARWIHVTTAVLNMGAARVEAAGPAPLTMTADDGVQPCPTPRSSPFTSMDGSTSARPSKSHKRHSGPPVWTIAYAGSTPPPLNSDKLGET